MTNLYFRYANFDTKLTIQDKINLLSNKFSERFKFNPTIILLNPIHEKDIGTNFNQIPVEYKSTLNLFEIDFGFPEGFVPSQSF